MANSLTFTPADWEYDQRLTTKVPSDVGLRLRMTAAITKQPIHALVTAALDHWLGSVEDLTAAATSRENPK